jgi:integrase
MRPDLRNRLAGFCAASGLSESAVISSGVGQYLDGTSDMTRLLHRLDRFDRALGRMHRDQQLFMQAFGIFVRPWFAHTPSVAEEDKADQRRGRASAQVVARKTEQEDGEQRARRRRQAPPGGREVEGSPEPAMHRRADEGLEPRRKVLRVRPVQAARRSGRALRLRSPVLVLLGGDACLRMGEILALRWWDVDVRRKQISVQQAVWQGVDVPKSGQGRVVPVTDALAAALQRASHLRGERVRYRDNGTPMSLPPRRIYPLSRSRPSLPRSPHSDPSTIRASPSVAIFGEPACSPLHRFGARSGTREGHHPPRCEAAKYLASLARPPHPG